MRCRKPAPPLRAPHARSRRPAGQMYADRDCAGVLPDGGRRNGSVATAMVPTNPIVIVTAIMRRVTCALRRRLSRVTAKTSSRDRTAMDDEASWRPQEHSLDEGHDHSGERMGTYLDG